MIEPRAPWESILCLSGVTGARRLYLPLLPVDVWLVQQVSQGSAQRCGSLPLCHGKGAAWDGFIMGLGLTLLLDTFQVPLSGLSYLSVVSPGWTGPFFLLPPPRGPECRPS